MTAPIELSEKQKEIVFAENIPIYVKASAGSGKTRVLTERVRYLLTKTNKKVLALTFTNKAGEEIKERLNVISGIEKRVFVGTFHGFCKTILENHGHLIGNAKITNIFEDLLLLAYNLFINFPDIAALYRRSFYAICIDEAQDLNNAQYQFLLALTNGEFSNIMMVGDPNQSIYHFNGSSPDYMDKQFVSDFNPIIIELKENYRSSKAVLSSANKVFPEVEYIAETVKEGIFKRESLADEEAESQWVIDKINELITLKKHKDIEGNITYEKMAILARNKYIFKPLETQLKKNGLPFYYKVIPGAVQFESDLMKIFDLALRVRLNPQDRLHKQRLLSLLKIKTTKNLDLDDMVSQVSAGWNKNIIKLVMELKDDGSNLKHLLQKFKDDLSVEDEKEKYMIFNDIDELHVHWSNYAKKTDSKSLFQFKNAMALGQTHPLTQHPGITLSTVHTMKGQEFDIVFVIGLDDETFPDYRAVAKGGIGMIQEKNNLYVAFTRAKRFLYITWPQKRMMPWGESKTRKISRFLKVFSD